MNRKGFTLVEVLITVGLISVIMTATVIVIQSTREKASNAIINQEKKEIATALRILGIDLNDYESSIYNCKEGSWISRNCQMDNSFPKKWQWVRVTVEELKAYGYLHDSSSRCRGNVTLYNGNINEDEDVLPEIDTVECS